MATELMECPHCQTRVVPMANGVCPACRMNTRDEPSPTQTKQTRDQAWDSYQESLRPESEGSTTESLRQVEQQFVDVRMTAIAQMGADRAVDNSAADRIRQELLPAYSAAIEHLRHGGADYVQKDHDTYRRIEHLKTREESWRILAEALRENDTEKLHHHLELWDRSEMLMVGLTAESSSQVRPSGAERVKEFERALVTFTPRVIATPSIVIINILVFAAMIVSGVHLLHPVVADIEAWGANFGPKTMNGQWWRLVTCMFLHFGAFHLAFNMWILWDLGRLVERLVGNFGFLVLYFVSGVAGSIASLAWNPYVVAAGASGAVFGVVGALFGLIAFRRDTIPVAVLNQLRNGMIAFLVYNLFYGLMATGIDMAAHVGGLAAGFACGLILSQPLSVDMLALRPVRNAAVLVSGAIVLPFAAFSLPDGPPDIDREMQRFADTEERVLDAYDSLVRQSHRGLVDDMEFAETLEREILPQWTEARKRIEELREVPNANRDYLSQLVRYLKAREESWQLLAEGLREQDDTKIDQANERWTIADEMVQEL